MKRIKLLSLIVLSLVMVFTLAACSGGNNTNEPASTNSSTKPFGPLVTTVMKN
jgi:uncharacterized lipoprotein YehR (DUF1307 family)